MRNPGPARSATAWVDLWVWSLYALIIYTRIAAERTGHSLSQVCAQIATRHSIDLTANRRGDR
jgi:hypothetical protein